MPTTSFNTSTSLASTRASFAGQPSARVEKPQSTLVAEAASGLEALSPANELVAPESHADRPVELAGLPLPPDRLEPRSPLRPFLAPGGNAIIPAPPKTLETLLRGCTTYYFMAKTINSEAAKIGEKPLPEAVAQMDARARQLVSDIQEIAKATGKNESALIEPVIKHMSEAGARSGDFAPLLQFFSKLTPGYQAKFSQMLPIKTEQKAEPPVQVAPAKPMFSDTNVEKLINHLLRKDGPLLQGDYDGFNLEYRRVVDTIAHKDRPKADKLRLKDQLDAAMEAMARGMTGSLGRKDNPLSKNDPSGFQREFMGVVKLVGGLHQRRQDVMVPVVNARLDQIADAYPQHSAVVRNLKF